MLINEPALVTDFLAARDGMKDDFGCMARLAVCLVFTDDGEITVLGPAARIERANYYAIYRSFGDGGASAALDLSELDRQLFVLVCDLGSLRKPCRARGSKSRPRETRC